MNDQTIFYSLSALGVVAHLLSVVWKRPDLTVKDWIKDKYNQRYLAVTVLATVVFVLVGPGDGADLASNSVRMNAFSFAMVGAEVVRTAILGPSRMAERKAGKVGKQNEG